MCGRPVSESERLPISGNGFTVVACAGHLLELVDPEKVNPAWGKPWSLDVLPIEIDDWPKEPDGDKADLVERIGDLLGDAECVIHAATRTTRASSSWTRCLTISGTRARCSGSTSTTTSRRTSVAPSRTCAPTRRAVARDAPPIPARWPTCASASTRRGLATKRLGSSSPWDVSRRRRWGW